MNGTFRRISLATILAFCLMAVVLAQHADRKPKGDNALPPKNDSISVTRFNEGKVIGLLGHPLGTVVRVTGVALDGDSTRAKADSGKLLLSVETVNGTKLTKPRVFEFGRADRSVVEPKPGDTFDYYVHEYGEFDGVVEPPEELGIEYEEVAHDGFYYRPYITIHKSLE